MSAVTDTQTAVTANAPDLSAIKTRQQATWASGDYSVVGSTLQIVGERLAEALDVRAGEAFLDVAAGNGNVTLAAARRFADVTSTDYVGTLLEAGRKRAEANGLSIHFQEADAEALPFESESFDVVASSFGVMFTPDQEQAASELVRVTRPGGRVGLANWTPSGFVGELFKTLGSFVAPPAGIRSPALWGTQDRLAELFATGVRTIEIEPRTFVFRYRSPQHWLDLWREVYGPLHKAFGALDETAQAQLSDALLAVVDSRNLANDGTMVVPGEYLEVVITKRTPAS
ncbi:MAG: class I SAM-dependent methyltransferase [Gaiellaceae bacterium]